MYCVKKMTEDLYWVGASERRLNLFENAYPLTNGVSYNSYLLLDEKTVLIDTVDKSVSGLFFENVDHVLAGRKLDYLIVQHRLQRQDAHDDAELLHVRSGQLRAARQGDGHAHDRQTHLCLRHGPDGALAGGHGVL